MGDTRKMLAAALLIITVAGTAVFVAVGNRGNNNNPLENDLYFVVYGQDWCPHCQAELKFLNSTFGPDKVEFRDLDNPDYQANFMRVVTKLNQLGIPVGPYFPLTGIHSNGRLVAVVQGEISSLDYLESILTNTEDGKVIVVLGENGYVMPPDSVLEEAFSPSR